jgi:hypothetical protein
MQPASHSQGRKTVAYLKAPNGERITATVETVIITYDILDVDRHADGSLMVEFYDDGGTVHWDSSEQIKRDGQPVFQTADGSEFLESELELVEDEEA